MAQSNDKRVLVCGAGLAGLTAAVTALEHGASTTLIEKAPEVGGTTALASGLIWTYSDYDRMRADIPNGDPVLQWLVYDTIDDARTWLAQQGVALAAEQQYRGFGRGRRINPPQAVSALAEKFLSLGGELLVETALDSLTVESNVVRGALTLQQGKLTEHRASAVVLATGGFQGNPELLSRYVVPHADNLYLRSNAWSTGDGFLAATDVGAAVSRGLGTFYGHALAAPPARFSKLQFRDVSQSYGRQSVAINLRGERFADESDSNTEAVLNQHLARQPEGRGFYIIDSEVMNLPAIPGEETLTRVMVERAQRANGPVVTANTLEELCRRLGSFGVPQQRLFAGLTHFNQCIEERRADDLVPSRRSNRRPLREPPFYAVAVKASITYTMGGLRIDQRARVLRRSGTTSAFAAAPATEMFSENESAVAAAGSDYRQTAIEGLYAAGCDTGNISNFGYLGGLAPALATGRVAGQCAAEFVRRRIG